MTQTRQQRHKTRQKQRGLCRVELSIPEALKRRVDDLRGCESRSEYITRIIEEHAR